MAPSRPLRVHVLLLAAVLVAAFPPAIADHWEQVTEGEDGIRVRYDHKGGNEWWVEVKVEAENLYDTDFHVQARDDGGQWVYLEKKWWGVHAASFHIEPGHRVQFRTYQPGGMSDIWSDESCWFTHPAGQEQCDTTPPPPPPPPPGGFTFDHKTGNEWWVEVLVSPKPQAVQAMDTGGSWKTLTLRSWGAWAGSFHIEPGHDVRFRAQDSSGAWHESCWFTHPAGAPKCGTPPPPPPPDGFDATFHKPSGNEWWVQVYVDANEPLAGVDARVDGGAWRALELKSWGAWARSIHAPEGSIVEFRARSADGDTDLSGKYRWPSAALVEDPPARTTWPSEGSFARYEVRRGTSIGQYSDSTDLEVTFTYTDGRWQARCVGEEWTTDMASGERTRVAVYDLHAALEPPVGDTDVAVGDHAEVESESLCRPFDTVLPVMQATTRQTTRDGESVTAPVWEGIEHGIGSCACGQIQAFWHRGTGLLVEWEEFTSNSRYDMRLLDTDARLAQGDEPLPPPPAPAWPKEGSYARYEVREWDNSTNYWRVTHLSYLYADGEWTWVCQGEFNTQGSVHPFRYEGTERPLLGPLDIGKGDHVVITGGECGRPTRHVVAMGTFYPEATLRNGQRHHATIWWGDEIDGERDRDAWWDVDTGLVLRWEDRSFDTTLGWLTDTDAPLSGGG